MVTLCFKLGNLLLKILKPLGFALTRLASSKRVACSLHGDSVMRIVDDDGRKRLVTLPRADTRDRRVSAVTSGGRRVARLATGLRGRLNYIELFRLLARRVVKVRHLLRDRVLLGEERVPGVVGPIVKVAAAKVGRNIKTVVELGRLIVDRRRRQVGESRRVRCREGLADKQVLGRDGAYVGCGARGRADVQVIRWHRRRRVGRGSPSVEGGELVKVAEGVYIV